MDRISLINAIVKKASFKTYLEIGTQFGSSFLPIKCANKMAVDPEFHIVPEKKIKWYFKNFTNFNNKYFEETSDEFFDRRRSILKKAGLLDVVLIDGLHTFEASLKDALNSLQYLNRDGLIIMHDCYPSNATSAMFAHSPSEIADLNIQDWDGEWCGDVWKTIVYLRRKYPEDLDACVIDTDYGLGVIRVNQNANLSSTIDSPLFEQVDALEYEDLADNPEKLINLKTKDYCHELIGAFNS